MARLRSASAYRKVKQPYTRKSKYRKHSFVKGTPGSKVVMFDVGNKTAKFPHSVVLISKQDVNLRHNAIEAGRVTATKYLEKILTKQRFHLKLRVVPHHTMRMNPLATGAGADRFSTGMQKAFGKPIGFSAHVKPGKILFQAFVNEDGIPVAKEAMRKVASKFPLKFSIQEAAGDMETSN